MRHSKTPRALAILLSIFLAAALLPACGKKSVRSDALANNESGTDLAVVTPTITPNGDLILSEFATNSDVAPQAKIVPTATPVPQDFAHVPDSVSMEPNPDVEAAKLKKTHSPKSFTLKSHAPEPTATAAPTVVTAEAPLAAEPTVALAAPIKVDSGNNDNTPSTGISWLWWLLLILLVALIGWYFWDRHKEHSSMGLSGSSLRPAPPLGGLSPVSGYFASKKAPSRTRSAKKRKR